MDMSGLLLYSFHYQVFGLFTAMLFANIVNWTLGAVLMRAATVMVRVPKRTLLPVVLLLTLTAVYAQEPSIETLWFTLGFGVLGYLMRVLSDKRAQASVFI